VRRAVTFAVGVLSCDPRKNTAAINCQIEQFRAPPPGLALPGFVPILTQNKTPAAIGTGGSISVACRGFDLHHTFALRFFACQFTGTADRFSFLARFFLGRFLEMLLELHFTENAFAL